MTAPAIAVESSRQSCTCERCVALCKRIPGFFKPGEAERAAELLGLSFDVFVRTTLTVAPIPDTSAFGLRPKIVNGSGRCTFLTPLGRCAIHAAKPFECAAAWCGDMWWHNRDEPYLECAREWYAADALVQIATLKSHSPIPRQRGGK